MRRALAAGAVGVGCVALVVWIELAFVPLGFNPTDDGYIVSQARRLFTGDMPHADVVSPRPLGSAFLHAVDLALPLPLYEATRLVFVVEMLAMTILFAWFVLARSPLQWKPLEGSLVASSALVNIHVFPLMPWHTTDGLTMLAAGLVAIDAALRHRSRGLLGAGFLLLGAAPVMKQSFVFAPVLGAVWCAAAWFASPGWRRRETLVNAAIAMAAAAAPGILYLLAVASAGGLGAMVEQLTGATRLPGYPIVDQFRGDPGRRQLIVLVSRLTAALVATRALELAARRVGWASVVAWVPRAVAAILVFRVVVSEDLTYGSMWAAKLTWALALVVVVRALLWRAFDGRAAVIVAAGLMSSLSWGYAVPNLVGGTTALALLATLVRDAPPPRVPRWAPAAMAVSATVVAVAAFAVLVDTFSTSRRAIVYFDHPEPALTATLGHLDADFGRLRATPVVRNYVEDVATCIERHPARHVAVLPDNPGLYPVLDLSNPLPLDWAYPPEYVGAEETVIAAARETVRRGGYLVMFQTFSAFDLRSHADLADAGPETPPFTYGDATLARIAELFATASSRVECGSFVAYYAPASSG